MCLGSLAVNDLLKCSGPLDREFSGRAACKKDPVDVLGCSHNNSVEVRSITLNKAPSLAHNFQLDATNSRRCDANCIIRARFVSLSREEIGINASLRELKHWKVGRKLSVVIASTD
jgi:hypothetical protein